MIRLHRPPCPNEQALQNGNYKHPDNKQALRGASADKCMYCESKVAAVDHAEIEHIKPKSKYPELTYVWKNLGYVCSRFNNAKGNQYDQNTSLIDPYSEDPEIHLSTWGKFFIQRQGSERGELTIATIQLNRPELLEKRLTRIEAIRRAVDACYRTKNLSLRKVALESLHREAEPDQEYSLFVRAFLESVISEKQS
ncbi:MAG: HNH endonuclease [Spirulinaceae cyanobacterium]